jgi:hypothetical protein
VTAIGFTREVRASWKARLALGMTIALVGGFFAGAGIEHERLRSGLNAFYRASRWEVVHEHAAQAPAGLTLLLGDSLIERQFIPELCGPALNAGVRSATSEDVQAHAGALIAAARPSRVVVNVGVNDAEAGVDQRTFRANYETILAAIGALPALAVGIPGGGPYDEILRRLAAERGAPYLAWPVDAKFTIDGLHLNVEGAAIWQSAAKAAFCG